MASQALQNLSTQHTQNTHLYPARQWWRCCGHWSSLCCKRKMLHSEPRARPRPARCCSQALIQQIDGQSRGRGDASVRTTGAARLIGEGEKVVWECCGLTRSPKQSLLDPLPARPPSRTCVFEIAVSDDEQTARGARSRSGLRWRERERHLRSQEPEGRRPPPTRTAVAPGMLWTETSAFKVTFASGCKFAHDENGFVPCCPRSGLSSNSSGLHTSSQLELLGVEFQNLSKHAVLLIHALDRELLVDHPRWRALGEICHIPAC